MPKTFAPRGRSKASVPSALLDGIATRYEVLGDGPPLLMYAPGGFDATVEKWLALGVYASGGKYDMKDNSDTPDTLAARENGHCGRGRATTVGPEDRAGDDEPGLDRQTRVRAHQAVGQQLDRDACRDVEADQRKERQDRRAERLQRDHAGAGGIVAISPKRTIPPASHGEIPLPSAHSARPTTKTTAAPAGSAAPAAIVAKACWVLTPTAVAGGTGHPIRVLDR